MPTENRGAVTLTGGEPPIHPEILDILRELRLRGLKFRVESDGTPIGDQQAQLLRDTATSVSISPDGPTAELHHDLRGVPGAFDRALGGVETLIKEGRLPFQIIAFLRRGTRPVLAAKGWRPGGRAVMPMNVLGNSMRPCLRPGTLVIVEEVEPGEIQVGNVIVLRIDGGQMGIHRVISTRDGILTQGDNMARPDGVVPAQRIVGKMVARWRGRQLRDTSRAEECLWLHAASSLRRLRSLLRAGAKLLAPLVCAVVPLRTIRFAAGHGGETVRLYLLKKLVAWRRTGAGELTMWVHPVFENTAVERRLRAIGATKDRAMKPGCPIANPEVAVNQKDDRGLLFNSEGKVHILNTTGTYLFGLLDGSHSREDLIECLMRHYEIGNREDAEKDVDEFLNVLKGKNMVGDAL
jgi:hypothetical protein